MITRSRGRQREYESRELGEVEREKEGVEGGGETGEEKKGRRDRESEAERESTKSRGP